MSNAGECLGCRAQVPGGRLGGVVPVVVGIDATAGVLVTVLVLTEGGGTIAVVVAVVTLLVVAVDDFRSSAAVSKLVVVTGLADPSERTCKAVRSPLAGKPECSAAG
ncbi:hypothetical protein NJB14197_08900 [Mycobacterium montefiorense]|uniref:Uncharacterized protein n=1 Tax=Mycobacterium montefiorense TaxID=154654 RepID=A0AA37PMJ5_9MYCO|nr:hypothetical protein MmonteBS_12090 [Mycobacterium montefiorense]GKU37744.1 hypothetical protein NJB14191_50900 [Mycobacterium montefiorense]GKU42702.1 hypothetical protein NJB14192_46850 [Mycobacterium montefiorense]GKU46422.1 hypothetical protein NJB14194_30410 [Mycobacterium montefiorense]GKU50995.1 hypothetical protein NJB14195_22410 [Mycobacterium montefiorense]